MKNIKITASDIRAVRLIKASGFIGINADGEPFLEGRRQIGRMRLCRLLEHKLLKSNQDGLPIGSITERNTQTYSLSRRGEEVVNA